MIESEEKRKRLTDIITRWSEYTKVINYLRPYDIHNLVGQVLDEFYSVMFSCGHLGNWEDGVHIAFKDLDDGQEGEYSGLYCRDCAEEYKAELGAWEVKEIDNGA